MCTGNIDAGLLTAWTAAIVNVDYHVPITSCVSVSVLLNTELRASFYKTESPRAFWPCVESTEAVWED